MSPELVSRAKRERWARDLVIEARCIVRNWIWMARHPFWAVFAFRIRMHYSFGWKYPPVPM